MTAKNDADRRSEEKRKRKRRALNQHLYRMHKELFLDGKDPLSGLTTQERINLHYDLHDGPNERHTHEDLEDWEALERENNGQ